ncbi:MAG TPA: UvrD-helicase domain-containing protein [Planctomycetota bacterium]|jgi:ATP-dependent helicase/nuclease subunit A|nr:UvrD-helicase domain-containing protein [Planctomycetota bacterium]
MSAARLADTDARRRAAAAFDQSVVVTASAGTGKTTLLVERALHLLLGDRRGKEGLALPILPGELLAVTFGEKAAGEMRLRLREALEGLAGRALPALDARRAWLEEAAERIRAEHGLGTEELARRAVEILPSLESARVTTLHSLAAEILRSSPLGAGVDPGFAVDEGEARASLFEAAWDEFLGRVLAGDGGPDRERWLRLLHRAGLADLRDLAEALASFQIPEEELSRIFDPPSSRPYQEWVREMAVEAARLAVQARRVGKARNVEKAALAAEAFLGAEGPGGEEVKAAAAASLRAIGSVGAVKGWEPEEVRRVDRLRRIAVALAGYDPSLATDLASTLLPFVREFRRAFLRAGWVSFDGLLTLARGVLLSRPETRAEWKRRFRAVLVDEFQDTDPVQGEIVLLLAEEEGDSAASGREVRVAPGKLFLVGDDKQSIYAFRGADLDACARVRERVLARGAGETLSTSFRSDPRILEVVNGLFAPLFKPGRFQPSYEPLAPGPTAPGEGPAVELRIWHRGADLLPAEEAARAEAESIAEEILRVRAEGRPWRSVALLFRALTRALVYLGALERRGIPYASEGEKFFHACPEVLDFVNLLAAVENPEDRLALAGVLRSPLGALADRELYGLAERGGLDTRRAPPSDLPFAAALAPLYEEICAAREEAGRLPLGEFLAFLFDRLPLAPLAGAAYRGGQAAANLEKVRAQARALAEEPSMTLARLVAELRRRGREGVEEREAPRFEESVDAVRVLSIHRAKGLEFDVVFLAGCHSGGRGGTEGRVGARFDWAAEATGARLGEFRTPAEVFLEARDGERQETERVRLFYVAATRARSRLVLSAARTKRRGDSILDALERAREEELPAPSGPEDASERALVVGRGEIRVRLAPFADVARPRPARAELPSPSADPSRLERAWLEREEALRADAGSPLLVTAGSLGLGADGPPLELDDRGEEGEGTRSRLTETRGRRVGTLCHRVLESWDFGAGLGGLAGAVAWASAGEGLEDPERGEVVREAGDLLRGFLGSPLAAEVARLRVRARELPLLLEWEGRLLRGSADLVAEEEDGSLLVIDWKTDAVDAAGARERAAAYAPVCAAYARAVASALGARGVRAALLFLRPAVRVEVPVSEARCS